MATNIIKQLQVAATQSATLAGVTISKASTWCDTFHGTAEALIASGLIAADQLPGQPNMPKVSATFYNGIRCDDRRRRVPRDLGYLNVSRPATGKKVTVQVGISAGEAKKRRDASNAELAGQLDARRARQSNYAAMSEAEFRETASNLVMSLWLVGSADDRPRADVYPFELSEDGADKLLTALRQVMSIISSAPLQSVTKERENLLKAQKDKAFQSFLRMQCIPSAGESHA
ncbi:hypothetical protein QFZ83_002177 [Variovorax sp. W1I1]|uniref:hypothetical protein n=1 Tax=Variovorax sp. W1I1 TaxID=3042309 RepID=UPI00277EE332|nr:hypothetical protein [Variovorax sp. W1I1]MDQ0608006.1 hypothetical protein [Variovorax sp. W1I1]